MRRAVVFCLVVVSPLLAGAKDPMAMHGATGSMAPEVRRTVGAFVGDWALEGTTTMPGGKEPAKMTGTMSCRPTALGTRWRATCWRSARSRGRWRRPC